MARLGEKVERGCGRELRESCPHQEMRSPDSCRCARRKDFCKSATTRTKEMSVGTEMKVLGFHLRLYQVLDSPVNKAEV